MADYVKTKASWALISDYLLTAPELYSEGSVSKTTTHYGLVGYTEKSTFAAVWDSANNRPNYFDKGSGLGNYTKYHLITGLDLGEKWCAAFVYAVFLVSHVLNNPTDGVWTKTDIDNILYGHSFSSSTWEGHFKSHNKLYVTPAVGSIMFKSSGHTALVTWISSDKKTFKYIDGNSGPYNGVTTVMEHGPIAVNSTEYTFGYVEYSDNPYNLDNVTTASILDTTLYRVFNAGNADISLLEDCKSPLYTDKNTGLINPSYKDYKPFVFFRKSIKVNGSLNGSNTQNNLVYNCVNTFVNNNNELIGTITMSNSTLESHEVEINNKNIILHDSMVLALTALGINYIDSVLNTNNSGLVIVIHGNKLIIFELINSRWLYIYETTITSNAQVSGQYTVMYGVVSDTVDTTGYTITTLKKSNFVSDDTLTLSYVINPVTDSEFNRFSVNHNTGDENCIIINSAYSYAILISLIDKTKANFFIHNRATSNETGIVIPESSLDLLMRTINKSKNPVLLIY